MRKLLLLCAIMFSTIGAWAQDISLLDQTAPVEFDGYSRPAEGVYAIKIMSKGYTGWMYNEGATYRMTTNATLSSLPKTYLWKVTHLDGDNLGSFTLTCLNNDVALTAQTKSHNIYNTQPDAVVAILKGERNFNVENFEGINIYQRNYSAEQMTEKGDRTKPYLHTNDGNNSFRYLSYWVGGFNSNATTGTACVFQFYCYRGIEYTLTDDAGNQYSGIYTGTAGVDEPTFTGVANLVLSNQVWKGNTFTANVSFPFPVSSASVTNPTLIVNGASWSNPDSRKWRATTVDGTDYVKIQTAAVNQSSTDALWAIYPQLTEGKFSVKIKNLKYNKFVEADPAADGNSGDNQDVTGYTKRVSLNTEGTAFEYKVRSGNNCHFTYLNSNQTELRLSMNGSGDTDVFMGVYNGTHSGNDVAFPDYTTNMTFPISVSSSTSTNAKMISAFKEGYSGNLGNFQYGFKWYSSGNSVKMKRMHSASVTNLDDFSWAIYPMPVGENMCYAIKNIKTGKYVYTTAKFTAQNNDNGDHSGDEVELSENPMFFQLNESNGAFYYYPSGSEITHYLSCNSTTLENEQFLGVWTSNHKGTMNEFLPLSFKVEVSDLGYATLYSPISVKQTTYIGGDIEPSVEVYSISEEPASGYVTLSSMEGGIPANQGAILKNAGTYYFTQDNNVSGDAWSDNLLDGSVVDTYVAGPAYVLANGANGVGLYKAELNKDANGATGTTHFKNNAGKAYLPASAAPSAARFLVFSFGDDMETGITETENGNVKTENDEVYDLAGRRVQGAQKGIFIVNGKKVVR